MIGEIELDESSSEDQEKSSMPKTEGREAEEQRTKYQSLASRNEKTAEYTLKSSKTPQNKSFYP